MTVLGHGRRLKSPDVPLARVSRRAEIVVVNPKPSVLTAGLARREPLHPTLIEIRGALWRAHGMGAVMLKPILAPTFRRERVGQITLATPTPLFVPNCGRNPLPVLAVSQGV